MAEILFGKVKRRRGLLEKIMRIIPGFLEYKLKKMRREVDKRIRAHIYSKLIL